MFDFAADARSEGGRDGMNHKGLVTFDRKYKKDAFFAYKAWLSDEPFVHLCGKRYIDRVEAVTRVTVYSNQPEVELFVNGLSLGKQSSDLHFFYYDVPNVGESQLTVRAGECRDDSRIRKVEHFNEAYIMKETGDVLNWFDVNMPDGYFSINDKIKEIVAGEEGRIFFASFSEAVKQKAIQEGKGQSESFDLEKFNMMPMLMGFTFKRKLSLMSMFGPGVTFTKEEFLAFNKRLNEIKKI